MNEAESTGIWTRFADFTFHPENRYTNCTSKIAADNYLIVNWSEKEETEVVNQAWIIRVMGVVVSSLSFEHRTHIISQMDPSSQSQRHRQRRRGTSPKKVQFVTEHASLLS